MKVARYRKSSRNTILSTIVFGVVFLKLCFSHCFIYLFIIIRVLIDYGKSRNTILIAIVFGVVFFKLCFSHCLFLKIRALIANRHDESSILFYFVLDLVVRRTRKHLSFFFPIFKKQNIR